MLARMGNKDRGKKEVKKAPKPKAKAGAWAQARSVYAGPAAEVAQRTETTSPQKHLQTQKGPPLREGLCCCLGQRLRLRLQCPWSARCP